MPNFPRLQQLLAGEDRGGRAGLDNFLSEEGLVGGGGESPSKAFAGQAGGDWPEGGRGGREAKLRPKPRANLGQPEEGGPAEQTPGESTFETRAFQN